MVSDRMVTVEFKEHEAFNVLSFIEENLFDVIRVDTDIDNFEWLKDLINVHQKLKEVTKDG